MPGDSPSARGSSNYEAVIVLRMEANNTQAKAKQAFTEAQQMKEDKFHQAKV
jgi:hypothetical protein